MSFIEINNVTYRYTDSKKNAVDDISVNIDEGELIAVIGHNGSGKSTFAKLMNGLLVPSEGTVCVNGIFTSDEDKRIEYQNKSIEHLAECNQLIESISRIIMEDKKEEAVIYWLPLCVSVCLRVISLLISS